MNLHTWLQASSPTFCSGFEVRNDIEPVLFIPLEFVTQLCQNWDIKTYLQNLFWRIPFLINFGISHLWEHTAEIRPSKSIHVSVGCCDNVAASEMYELLVRFMTCPAVAKILQVSHLCLPNLHLWSGFFWVEKEGIDSERFLLFRLSHNNCHHCCKSFLL